MCVRVGVCGGGVLQLLRSTKRTNMIPRTIKHHPEVSVIKGLVTS